MFKHQIFLNKVLLKGKGAGEPGFSRLFENRNDIFAATSPARDVALMGAFDKRNVPGLCTGSRGDVAEKVKFC
jgi:hypothetical protein